jgi:hypothetical protein
VFPNLKLKDKSRKTVRRRGAENLRGMEIGNKHSHKKSGDMHSSTGLSNETGIISRKAGVFCIHFGN